MKANPTLLMRRLNGRTLANYEVYRALVTTPARFHSQSEGSVQRRRPCSALAQPH